MSPHRLSVVANLLTFIRLPMAAAIWIFPEDAVYLLSIMVMAAVTDMLDGAVARRAHEKARAEGQHGLDRAARTGAWLDPLCDKTFVASVLVAVYVTQPAALWLLLIIAAREFILVPAIALGHLFASREDRRHVFFAAGPLGKATTVAQFLAIGAIVLEFPSWLQIGMTGLAAVLGLLAAVHYIVRARSTIRSARRQA